MANRITWIAASAAAALLSGLSAAGAEGADYAFTAEMRLADPTPPFPSTYAGNVLGSLSLNLDAAIITHQDGGTVAAPQITHYDPAGTSITLAFQTLGGLREVRSVAISDLRVTSFVDPQLNGFYWSTCFVEGTVEEVDSLASGPMTVSLAITRRKVFGVTPELPLLDLGDCSPFISQGAVYENLSFTAPSQWPPVAVVANVDRFTPASGGGDGGAIAALGTQIAGVGSAVASLQSAIGATASQSSVDAKASQASVDSIAGDVIGLVSSVGSLSTAVGDLQASVDGVSTDLATDVADLNARLTTIEAKIDVILSRLKSK